MSDSFEAPANSVETVIIGAGPVGLFQIFELGLLGMRAAIIDSLAQVGGQCTELYPDKPIYDIPALPVCGAQELIDRLLEQVKPFHASFHLGQEVTELKVQADGKFHLATSLGTRFTAGAVVIAAGVGSFQPRRLVLDGADRFEGKSLHYRIKSAADFHGQDLVICGGGTRRSTGRWRSPGGHARSRWCTAEPSSAPRPPLSRGCASSWRRAR